MSLTLAKGKVQIRRMVHSDLAAVEKLARTVRFDVGYPNFSLYYRTSPDNWEVAENEKKEIIAFCGRNKMNNGITYGYAIAVREDYRGHGITREFNRFWYTEPCMGSSTHFSILRYKFDIWLDKRLSFFGLIDPQKLLPTTGLAVPGIKLKPIQHGELSLINEYDKDIVKIDRRTFLEQWLFPSQSHNEHSPLSRSVAAWEEDGKCAGYGTLRRFARYFTISPLYADKNSVAFALYSALAQMLSLGDYLYVPGMANQRTNFQFCLEMGMTITETEVRNASLSAKSYNDSLPMDKVYAVHEFWPV